MLISINTFKILAVVILLVCTAGSTVADEVVRVTESPRGNAFYVNYEIVNDHPACLGEDKLAFRVTTEMQNLNYSIYDPDGGHFHAFGDFEQEQKSCYRIERRGGEINRYETFCPEIDTLSEEAIAAIYRNPFTTIAISLDATVDVTTCLSPVVEEIIDGSWSATLHYAGSSETIKGKVALTQDIEKNAAGEPTFSEPVVLMSNRRERISRSFWHSYHGVNRLEGLLNATPAIYVRLQCLPFLFQHEEIERVLVKGPLWLFLADNEIPTTCEGPDCPILNDDSLLRRDLDRCPDWF